MFAADLLIVMIYKMYTLCPKKVSPLNILQHLVWFE